MDGMSVPEAATPQEMPELVREMQMLGGAASSVLMRANELETKLKPITVSVPEDTAEKPAPESFPARTTYGQDIRQIYHQLAEVETVLSRLLYRVGL